ncbi:hypothetical protein ACFE04_011458 [Oxalis oulophora]
MGLKTVIRMGGIGTPVEQAGSPRKKALGIKLTTRGLDRKTMLDNSNVGNQQPSTSLMNGLAMTTESLRLKEVDLLPSSGIGCALPLSEDCLVWKVDSSLQSMGGIPLSKTDKARSLLQEERPCYHLDRRKENSLSVVETPSSYRLSSPSSLRAFRSPFKRIENHSCWRLQRNRWSRWLRIWTQTRLEGLFGRREKKELPAPGFGVAHVCGTKGSHLQEQETTRQQSCFHRMNFTPQLEGRGSCFSELVYSYASAAFIEPFLAWAPAPSFYSLISYLESEATCLVDRRFSAGFLFLPLPYSQGLPMPLLIDIVKATTGPGPSKQTLLNRRVFAVVIPCFNWDFLPSILRKKPTNVFLASLVPIVSSSSRLRHPKHQPLELKSESELAQELFSGTITSISKEGKTFYYAFSPFPAVARANLSSTGAPTAYFLGAIPTIIPPCASSIDDLVHSRLYPRDHKEKNWGWAIHFQVRVRTRPDPLCKVTGAFASSYPGQGRKPAGATAYHMVAPKLLY